MTYFRFQNFSVWLEQLRILNWIKNLIILVPFILYFPPNGSSAALDACATFLAFCLLASSVYIINDLHDLEEDQRHQARKNRPISRGLIAKQDALYTAAVLIALGLLLTFLVNLDVLLVGLIYLVSNFLYTYKLKHKYWVGACLLAFFHILRFFAGVAAGRFPHDLLGLIFVSFLFLALGISSHQETYNTVWGEKRTFFIYKTVVCFSLAVLALYAFAVSSNDHFANPIFLLGLIPAFIYLYLRFWHLSKKSYLYAYRLVPILLDRKIWYSAVAMLIIVVLAKFQI